MCDIEGRESDCLSSVSERRRWFTAEHVKLGDDHGGDVEHAGILNQVICTDWVVGNQPGYNLGFQCFFLAREEIGCLGDEELLSMSSRSVCEGDF